MRKMLSLPQAKPKAHEAAAMLLRFDLTDLQLFLHIAEAGSITHGASRANMSLASASERVRAMEDALHTSLLERKRRGVHLTPAGAALVHHARIVTQQLEQMRGDLNEYATGLRGNVRLLAIAVVIAEFLPTALAAFLLAYPNIDIGLEERSSLDIVRAIAEGLADIGIVGDTLDPALELETFPLAADRLVLVAPHRHTLASHRKIAFREVLHHDFIGLVAGNSLQQYLDNHAARAGRQLRLRVRLSGFEAICRMVESNVGLAVLHETVARRCQRSMAIRLIPLTDAWALRHFTVCYRSFKSLPVHAQRVVEYLRPRSPAP
jgi:molybdate transport repressor ModE-like protein